MPNTQELVLVPVRPGRLFLPAVHVHLLPKPSSAANGFRAGGNTATARTASRQGQGPDAGVVCETFVVNAGEVVDVLPAGKSRTVLVPIPQRDGWEV
jgi:hypothetical protein